MERVQNTIEPGKYLIQEGPERSAAIHFRQSEGPVTPAAFTASFTTQLLAITEPHKVSLRAAYHVHVMWRDNVCVLGCWLISASSVLQEELGPS